MLILKGLSGRIYRCNRYKRGNDDIYLTCTATGRLFFRNLALRRLHQAGPASICGSRLMERGHPRQAVPRILRYLYMALVGAHRLALQRLTRAKIDGGSPRSSVRRKMLVARRNKIKTHPQCQPKVVVDTFDAKITETREKRYSKLGSEIQSNNLQKICIITVRVFS